MIIAIDPGTSDSAICLLDSQHTPRAYLLDNTAMMGYLNQLAMEGYPLYIEMVASYGMAVGRSVFETCVWIGRFAQVWHAYKLPVRYIYRKDIKMALCGQTRAKDANIRQAIMDLYGSEKGIAIGNKAQPGPLYGFKKDMWAALAVAIAVDINPNVTFTIPEVYEHG